VLRAIPLDEQLCAQLNASKSVAGIKQQKPYLSRVGNGTACSRLSFGQKPIPLELKINK
jgi:hypothetical protein